MKRPGKQEAVEITSADPLALLDFDPRLRVERLGAQRRREVELLVGFGHLRVRREHAFRWVATVVVRSEARF